MNRNRNAVQEPLPTLEQLTDADTAQPDSDELPVGTEPAQPTFADVATAALIAITDDTRLHEAILARREWLLAEAKLLTRWAKVVRERKAAATSQRAAAGDLKVSRRSVRTKP